MKNSIKKEEKGITLIALVITIIVLLILAGVAIDMLSGENGILTKAAGAKERTEAAQEREERELAELEDLINNNGNGSLTGYNEEKQVNKPKLTGSTKDVNTGLIPIKYKEGNWVVCAEDDKEWYDYDASKMQWANAMLSDGKYKVDSVKVGQVVKTEELGSMFVWIPRYAYSMTTYKTTKTGTADSNNGTTQNITEVEYLKGSSNTGASGKVYPTDYNASTVVEGEKTPMIVHPAFKFGGANLRGIWVAKFEASMAGTNVNTTAENDTKALEKTVKVVPNAESWRYITVGKAFQVCYNMRGKGIYKLAEGTNTHQIKNSEWGAVAYLAASQYGKVPATNGSGSSYQDNGVTKYHSYCAAGNYETNKTQSTTGNVNGIYDMNGGA